MKNLKVWQKLTLLGLVFLLPFAIVTVALVSSVNTDEIDFAQQEIHGVDYIIPARNLMKEVQRRRAYITAHLNGDTTARSRLLSQQENISRAIAGVDQVDQKLGAALEVSSKWQELKTACMALSAAQDITPSSGAAGQTLIDSHSRVINDLILFIKRLGDVSKLTLDPDLDSYYLMDIVVFKGPDLAGVLDDTYNMGIAPARSRRLSPTLVRDINRSFATSDYLLGVVELDLDKSFSENESIRQRHTQLSDARTTSHTAVLSFLQTVERTLAANNVNVTAPEYSRSATSAIEAAYNFQEAATPALRELLVIRQDKSRQKVMTTLLWAIGGLLVVSLIGLLLVRDITRPLNQVVGAAHQIATGNLSVRLPSEKRTDELGVLTATFNHMLESLQRLAGAAGKIAGGDLTTRVQAQTEHDALGSAFATMSENIHRMVGDLSQAVNVLGSSASEIVASTAQLAAGATQTATAVSETTTTVEEIRQTAEVSNQKARHVADNAQKLAHISQSGKKAAEDSRQGMDRIRQQMASIADSMVELSEQSQAIGAIIATVDDLTQQSNLLAVNAAIEAAKAGEQGKGFAVVAQEVKSLAEQSRQATAQVRTILSDIQKATGAAVMATEQGSKAVEAGVQQAGQAGESIVTLSESVTEAAHAATQIAASSQQQLVGMEQMVLAMESIKQASTQNVDSARQLEASARDLGDLGTQLKQLVEHYKV